MYSQLPKYLTKGLFTWNELARYPGLAHPPGIEMQKRLYEPVELQFQMSHTPHGPNNINLRMELSGGTVPPDNSFSGKTSPVVSAG